jgi:hypothetical protein
MGATIGAGTTYPSGARVFNGLGVAQFAFVDHCLSGCPFSSGHCIVCPSIYGFWLLIQTFLPTPSKSQLYLLNSNLYKLNL